MPAPWITRKFNFDYEENLFPCILERLRGTPARLEEKVRTIPNELLTMKLDGKWSILEHIGHLADLEPLGQIRFRELQSGAETLTHADMSNKKTHDANYNKKPLSWLLEEFRYLRTQTVRMVENIDEEMIYRKAHHPRLNKPMRTMDLFLFVCEHDDHHLAWIEELKNMHQNQYSRY